MRIKKSIWKIFCSLFCSIVILSPAGASAATTECLHYSNVTIYDDRGDESKAPYDIVSVQMRQIGPHTVRIKATMRGNPWRLLEEDYLYPEVRFHIDADNDPDSGSYKPEWDLGEEFNIRVGFQYHNHDKLNAFACTDQEGKMVSPWLPVFILGNSFYVYFSLEPYQNLYAFGSSLRFAAESFNSTQVDTVAETGVLELR